MILPFILQFSRAEPFSGPAAEVETTGVSTYSFCSSAHTRLCVQELTKLKTHYLGVIPAPLCHTREGGYPANLKRKCSFENFITNNDYAKMIRWDRQASPLQFICISRAESFSGSAIS